METMSRAELRLEIVKLWAFRNLIPSTRQSLREFVSRLREERSK